MDYISNIEKMREMVREHDLLRSEVEAFFDLSVDLLAVATTEGYFIRLNRGWNEALGWSEEELMSKPFIEFVHPEDVAATLKTSEDASKGLVTNFRNRYLTKSGDYVTLDWRSKIDWARGVIFASARVISEEKSDGQDEASE